jgi:hypothetical protein
MARHPFKGLVAVVTSIVEAEARDAEMGVFIGILPMDGN